MSDSQPKAPSFADKVPTWAIVGLFVAAAVIGVLAFALRDKSPATGSAYEARQSCQRAVDTRLKSPGTSDYSSENATHVGVDWTITGSVDSENSFGGTVRNTYSCKLKYENDNWTLVDLQTSGN